MSIKPSIPKGTRDFLPTDFAKFSYVKNIIKEYFKIYGYVEIKTPSFEKTQTLSGKYGDDGEKLIFHILNSGEKLKKSNKSAFNSNNLLDFRNSISDKALRYDLTVPLARFVTQNQNEINFPFKRFQIENVWRADRPQHGRYQEFVQCDADVVGNIGPVAESEIINLVDDIFSSLKIKNLKLKINHREILNLISVYVEEADKFKQLTISFDKIDKIGVSGVIDELINDGFSESAVDKIKTLLSFSGTNAEKFEFLKNLFKNQSLSDSCLNDLKSTMDLVAKLKTIEIEFDFSLARGLGYYTGIIFELIPPNGLDTGSIAGGGRYDNLTNNFGLKNISGVGISLGIDRICHVLEILNLFPKKIFQSIDILVLNFGDSFLKDLIQHIQEWRKNNQKVLVYPSNQKLKKQMQYANHIQAKWVVFFGENEKNNDQLNFKNMITGKTISYKFNEFNISNFLNQEKC